MLMMLHYGFTAAKRQEGLEGQARCEDGRPSPCSCCLWNWPQHNVDTSIAFTARTFGLARVSGMRCYVSLTYDLNCYHWECGYNTEVFLQLCFLNLSSLHLKYKIILMLSVKVFFVILLLLLFFFFKDMLKLFNFK